ncbi:MAG: GNAT family N-acetyltransferase [Magnetovibrio sp.]|nr:GNAT family N-acetyltransferase [Magnetovibrio sp.]
MTDENKIKTVRGAPRSQKSHKAILAAALYLANTGGPQALTIEGVARQAKVGKQTIYRWWPTRLDLWIEVYDAYSPALKGFQSKQPLPAVLRALFKSFQDGPAGDLLVAMIALSRSTPGATETFQTHFVEPRKTALVDYLILSGEMESDKACDAADLMISLTWHALLCSPQKLTAAYADKIATLVRAQAPFKDMETYTLKEGYTVGIAGKVCTMHMDFYGPEWKLGQNFEAYIARDIGLFLDKYDPVRDQILRVENQYGVIVGTLFVETSGYPDNVARLRLFYLEPKTRGLGWGKKMLDLALKVCLERGQTKLFLTTFKGLHAAQHVYEKAGFKLTEKYAVDDWKEGTQELRFDLNLLKR